MQTLKCAHFFFLSLLLTFSSALQSQSTLEGGDLAVVGVNANNSSCGIGGEDLISFVCFKDIESGTIIHLTDNGWERVNPGFFGDSEGTLEMTYTGATIPAGQVITLSAVNSPSPGVYTCLTHTGWNFNNVNSPPGFSMNMNSSGDQIYFMQGGTWDIGNPTGGTHDASYIGGNVLFGFNTQATWTANGTSQQSNLHPDVTPCFHMEPSSGQSDFLKYTGPMTSVTQLDWIDRISDPNNWTSFPSCTDYNSASPNYAGIVNLPIATSGMSISCTTCSSSCPGFNETLVFNLPSSGGPFNVVYTDGTNNFTLNSISNGHVESLIINQSTTFSLVSVTALNGCPVFSNFDGEAMVTVGGGGGGGNASISGGGILCSENCSNVTINITGGTAPYTVGAAVTFLPLVNNFPISFIAPNTNFTITLCSQGVLPSFDPATATLNIPSAILGNGSITLTSLTDNTGCNGTVDGTPFGITIETTPTAIPTSMEACDNGNGIAIFDLTSQNNTVNGGSGNTVTWFQDAAATVMINNPSSYSTSSTTVFAVVSTVNCDSDPVSVTLNVNQSPSTNPITLGECSSTNQAVFDLTSINSAVNGGSGFPITWYTDPAATNPINDPTAYVSGNGFVYAVVTGNGCASQPETITLLIVPAPSGTPTTITECESQLAPGFADFDLNAVNNIVNGGSGEIVEWFMDITTNIPIPTGMIAAQNNTTVYALVGSAPCTSSAVPVTLIVTPAPTANTANLDACAQFNNQAVFDLTSVNLIVNGASGNPVSWFEDINGNNQIFTPANYLSGSAVVFAVVSNGNCSSAATPINLNVIPAPTANPAITSACDLGNGTADFDLNAISNQINNQPGNTISWFFDINAQIPIPSPFNSFSTTVYAVASNGICSSQVASVNLIVETAPIANNAFASACDLGNGTATFDLTLLESEVNSNGGLTFTWFSDPNATNPIPTSYTTGTAIIYVVVSNGTCESQPTLVSLTVEAAPTANSFASDACDLGNNTSDFDLAAMAMLVNSNPTYAVSWFLSPNATNQLMSPFTTSSTSVYAVVSGSGCSSQPTEVLLNVLSSPTGNPTTATECEVANGQAIFDLTNLESTVNGGTNDPVTWFSDINASVAISSPYTTGTTVVYAVVTGSNNCSSVPVAVDLIVAPIPTAFFANDTECDLGNGTANFDLLSLENTVNGGTGYNVLWYSDNAATNPISSPYNSGTSTVYAVVDDGTCTSQVAAVTLTVDNQTAANPTAATECDEGNGTATFDLLALEDIINGNSGNNVTWYADPAATIDISAPFFITGTTTVYATVGSGGCVSNPVEVDLTVASIPTAISTTTSLCDEGNGMAQFILTDLNETVNGNTMNSVNWYSNANATILIPSLYNTGTTTVFAVVSDGTCESEPTPVNLIVEDLPIATSTSADECNEGNGTATFALTNLENIVNGGSGNSVQWFTNSSATNVINPPFTTSSTTIYAVIDDGTCTSLPVSVDLTVINGPSISPASAEACDEGNGTATFDLTALESTVNDGTTNQVTWFSDANATNQIFSPYNTSSATIYAVVDDGSTCPSPIEAIDLTVLNLPAANPASDTECGNANGLATFDLDVLANTVNGGNGNTVSWYTDINLTNAITFPTFTTIATTIYAVVDNGTCQAAAVPVTLNISNTISATATTLAACDDGSGNNTGIFDLTGIENEINGGNGYTVLWFTDPAATIPVTPPLNAYLSGSTSLYVIVESGTCTSTPVEIPLTVLGEIDGFQTSVTECDDGAGIGIFDLDDIADIITGGNGNTVLWYSDMALTMQISSPFSSTPTTIYAVATDGICFSNIVEVLLNVTAGASGNETSASACDDGTGTATFDLSSLSQEVNSSTLVTIDWFSDINLTNQIFSPYTTPTTTVYAIVSNNLCTSDPVEVDLEVVTELDAFPATGSECDQGNGTATFNLNELASEVNGGNGTAVVWYSDPNLTTQISSPYVSADATIYAATTDGTCFSDPVEVTLVVANSIPAFPASDSACDEGNGTATFTLTNLENTINGGSGVEVNFYEDNNLTIPITPPFASISNTIYAVAVDGNCTSIPVEVDLTVLNLPVANSTSVSMCETANGEAAFDLTNLASDVNGGNSNTVLWYSDENATTAITSPFTSPTATVYATVTDANCTSNPVPVSLTVIDGPVANATTQVQCDEGNGEASFDLTALNSTVNGGSGNPVTWYSDASATNLIPSPYVSSSTNVYAVVSDGMCESAPTAVTLEITTTVDAFPTTDTQCDIGNGTAIFDLDLLDDAVNGGTGFEVEWFFSPDAINPIPTLYTSSPTTVYAVVVDGICTSTPVPVDLMVMEVGTTNPAADSECGDGNGIATFELTNLENTINGGSGNTIMWFEDVNMTTPITPPFTTTTATIYAVSTNGNCESAPIAISLSVTPLTSANPASNVECDDGTGTAVFNLNSLTNTINGGTGFDVLWYEDINLTIPFTPSNAFTTTTTSLYAVVDDGACMSLPVEVSLMVAADVNSSPASMTLCNDGNGMANFDLDEIVDIVNQGTGNDVFWFEDANLTIPISSPFNTTSTTIYAISQLGNCDSDPVEITLEVSAPIPAVPTTTSLCDEGNGQATFDLSTLENTVNDNTSNQVSWYEDANATIPIGTSITSGATSVFAQTTDGTCLSQVVEIQLAIDALPIATPTSTSLCDEGNGQATFDLTLLENVVNGGTASSVSWFENSNASIPLGTSITSGTTSIFATINDGTCNSEVVEIELMIDALPSSFPAAASLCDEGNGEATFDLSQLENTINGGSTNTVAWFEDNNMTTPIGTSLTTATTSVFAVVNDGTCNSEVVEINLSIDALPQANPTSITECNNGNGIGDFELTGLENIINGNTTNTVLWFEDSNATIPANTSMTTATTSVFALVDNGTCISAPVEIELIVDDQVPAFPTASSECDSGNGEATFDLSLLENTVNGNSTNTVTWFEDNNATISIGTNITTTANSVFAIVNDGTCNSTVVEIQLQIDPLPDAFATGTSLCDEGNGTANFDLTLLENNITGGNGNTVTWFEDPSGNNPIATSISTSTTSVYARVSDGTCESALVEVELTIDPFSTNDIVETLCFGESMIVNNQVYDQDNSSGTEITQAANGCDSIITIDLSFEAEVIGSIAASVPTICPGGSATLTFSLIGGTTFDVEYSLGNNPPITLNGISDGHTITVAPTGTTTYNLVNVSPVGSVCTGTLPTNQVTVVVETMNAIAQPETDFSGFNVSCFGGNDGAAVAGPTSGVPPFDYQWDNGAITPFISNLAAGTYEITITDATGCTATTSVALSEPSEIQFTTIPVAPPCTDAVDGEIYLEDVTGGVGPYTFSFDNGAFNAVNSNSVEIDFVAPGIHTVTVMDENGCEINQEVTILEPDDAVVDLGPDQTLELGDSIELQPIPNFNVTEIVWSDNAPCSDCPSQFVTPINQSTYLITVLDESGCIASDTITIFVEKPRRVFIPNAFSPDDNGVNDIFYINAGQQVANVKNFKIFNRWGALLFSQENFQPNDSAYGWDGFYKNKKLNPGVYVYFAEIEFIDGQVIVYKGDVTLVR